MQRRKFSREFKIEAVRLVKERGVAVAQAARDLDVHENVLRKWVKEFAVDPTQAFPGHGQIKADQLEIDRLRREGDKTQGGARHPKKLSRAIARLRTVETASAMLAAWRVAAVSLLEAQSPLKNVVHGCMRT